MLLSTSLCTLAACESPGLTGVAPCLAHDTNFGVPPIGPPGMDLLLVVDTTPGMEAAHAAFAAVMPRLVETLRSGTQADRRQLPPPSQVRIGVITSDMGAAGYERASCPPLGDDGLLQLGPACASDDLPFLALRSHLEVSEDFGAQLRCAANVGTGACGPSQPLEALLKAVTPASSELTFASGSGHSERNQFITGRSLGGVIVLTSGDDCSAADAEFFDPEGPYADAPIPCRQDGALHPLERFIDGLASAQYLDSIAFGVIAGVPPDLITDPITPDYAALIGPERDPRMDGQLSRGQPTEVLSSCAILGAGDAGATPPPRLVELLQRLEEADAAVVLGSICAPNFTSFADAFAEQLGLLNGNDCLPRPRERDQAGRVRCDVIEILPAEEHCIARRGNGRVLRNVDEEGRDVCLICQSNNEGVLIDSHPECQTLAEEGIMGVGWFYEEGESVRGCGHGRAQAIEFFAPSYPTTGALLRLECPLRDDELVLGQRCNESQSCETQLEDLPAICEPTSGTCQAPCERDSDCAPAGPTYQCVTYGDARYCLNTTCQ